MIWMAALGATPPLLVDESTLDAWAENVAAALSRAGRGVYEHVGVGAGRSTMYGMCTRVAVASVLPRAGVGD